MSKNDSKKARYLYEEDRDSSTAMVSAHGWEDFENDASDRVFDVPAVPAEPRRFALDLRPLARILFKTKLRIVGVLLALLTLSIAVYEILLQVFRSIWK